MEVNQVKRLAVFNRMNIITFVCTENQGMTMARKKKLAKQGREEGLTFRNRLKNCDY